MLLLLLLRLLPSLDMHVFLDLLPQQIHGSTKVSSILCVQEIPNEKLWFLASHEITPVMVACLIFLSSFSGFFLARAMYTRHPSQSQSLAKHVAFLGEGIHNVSSGDEESNSLSAAVKC